MTDKLKGFIDDLENKDIDEINWKVPNSIKETAVYQKRRQEYIDKNGLTPEEAMKNEKIKNIEKLKAQKLERRSSLEENKFSIEFDKLKRDYELAKQLIRDLKDTNEVILKKNTLLETSFEDLVQQYNDDMKKMETVHKQKLEQYDNFMMKRSDSLKQQISLNEEKVKQLELEEVKKEKEDKFARLSSGKSSIKKASVKS
jgi:hypothetical protein